MRILRVRLRNYRGTGEREIRPRADGITVVSGPNEAGKSSLIEAFRLALKFRDSSKAAAVKSVQPVGTDLPTEVEVELRCGQYHFTLLRRWHRDTSTQLIVHAPQREEHAGRLADERLQEILHETVDSDLLDALHMGQDDKQLDQATPNPWGGALAEALLAGREQVGCRLDTTLVDLAAEERGRWLTRTGREKKELKAFSEAIQQADARLAEIRAAQEELEACVEEHDRLRSERGAVVAQLDQARAALGDLALRHSRLKDATAVRDRVAAEADAAAANARATQSALAGRRTAVQRVTDLEARIRAAVEAADTQEAEREAAESAATAARQAASASARRAEELGGAAAAAETRARRAELAEQLSIARAQRDSEVWRVDAARSAASPAVVLEMLGDAAVTIDGESIQLPAGATRNIEASAATVVEVPGMARLRVEPGAATVELRETAERAAASVIARLDEAIARYEVELDAVGGCPGIDASVARQEAESAARDALQAQAEATRAERAAADAEAQARQLASLGRQVGDQLAEARRFLAEDLADLARARAEAADDELESAADSASRAAELAAMALAEAESAVAKLAADSLPDRVELLEDRIAQLQRQTDAARDRLSALAERARLLSEQGLHTRLQDAEAERDALVAEWQRDRRRAEVADLLWATLDSHRRNAESAYRDPLRMRIEELGRALLGPSFSVEMSHDLRVARRRLEGRTMDVAELSAGAREQLALIGRVACASLAARDGAGAPLILDDTLGFSDPDRRRAVSRLLSEATGGCQVIVLTCDPERYAELEGAELIQL